MADLGRFKGMGRKYRRAWQIGVFVTLPGLVLGTGTVAGAYGMGVIGQAKVTCEPVVVRAPARAPSILTFAWIGPDAGSRTTIVTAAASPAIG